MLTKVKVQGLKRAFDESWSRHRKALQDACEAADNVCEVCSGLLDSMEEPEKAHVAPCSLFKEIYENAKAHGWYDGAPNVFNPVSQESVQHIAMKLALIHSEVSEALEGLRRKKGVIGAPGSGAISEELADVVIRCADLAGYLGIDLWQAILDKHEYNKGREYRHGGKAC